MGVHRFQLNSINARLVGQLSEPGLTATALAALPQIDITLSSDANLTALTEAMAQFGYTFVASSPTTPRATQNLLIDLTDPGSTTSAAPASAMRLRYDDNMKSLMLSVDGTAYVPIAENPSNGAIYFDDFVASNGTILGETLWSAAVSGTNAAATIGNTNVSAQRQGMLVLTTGTQAAGRASALQAGLAYSNVSATSGGSSRIEFATTFLDALSVAAQTYTFMAGYSDNVGGTGFGSNAALLVHDLASSATNWVAKSIVGGVATNTVTTIAISAVNTYDKLLVDLSSANTARYYVNGVLAATHAISALPAATVGWAPIVKMEKTNGTVARRAAVDYASWSYRLSPAR